jgi:dihydropteroate synthase
MIIHGRRYRTEDGPHVFGVVNLSPDSPNQDSIALDAHAAVDRARLLVRDGASIIDVGAQSSYFDAQLLSADEEAAKLLPALRALKHEGFTVSVDTFRAEVAEAAIAAGADVLNDSEGFQDAAMADTLSKWGGPVILPFISGPNPHRPVPFNFIDPMSDILPFLTKAAARAAAAGLRDVLIDPGTGYRYRGVGAAEKERYQLKVYAALPQLRQLGHPLLVALPRKEDPARTLELVRLITRHADFVRAHDPKILAEAAGRATVPGGEG